MNWMSIFQSVQKAESKAETIKNEAIEKVNRLLEKVRVDGEKQAKLIIDGAYKKEKKINEETSDKIENIKQEIFAAYSKEEERFCKIAKQNFSKTVNYIVEKVFSL